METKMRVAVIGAGNMGRHHIRNYWEMDNVELVAIADNDPSSKELAEQFKAKHFVDFRHMLDECEIDAISIVVPTPLHFEFAIECMERGIHVLLEKPIASTLEEADALIEKSAEKKIVFTVGHIERYNPVIETLKELVDSERLGQISSIVSQRLGGFPSSEPKTDVILDLAIHDIDILNYLTGHQGTICGVHGSRTFHSKEVDSAEIPLKHSNASGSIQAPEKYEPLRRELDAFVEAVQGGHPKLLVDPRDARKALQCAMDARNNEKMQSLTASYA